MAIGHAYLQSVVRLISFVSCQLFFFCLLLLLLLSYVPLNFYCHDKIRKFLFTTRKNKHTHSTYYVDYFDYAVTIQQRHRSWTVLKIVMRDIQKCLTIIIPPQKYRHTSIMTIIFIHFYPERDYVTFGYLPSQLRLSVVCLPVVCL